MIYCCLKWGDYMNYNELKNLEDERKTTLSSMFIGIHFKC